MKTNDFMDYSAAVIAAFLCLVVIVEGKALIDGLGLSALILFCWAFVRFTLSDSEID